jgi:hypothetical protein
MPMVPADEWGTLPEGDLWVEAWYLRPLADLCAQVDLAGADHVLDARIDWEDHAIAAGGAGCSTGATVDLEPVGNGRGAERPPPERHRKAGDGDPRSTCCDRPRSPRRIADFCWGETLTPFRLLRYLA